MIVTGIDPGYLQSALVEYNPETHSVLSSRTIPNREALDYVRARPPRHLVIEMINGMGMAVGKEVFETCVWIGRFDAAYNLEADMIYRREVKLHMCGNSGANDGNIRRAVLDRFPMTGGGKIPQIGTKAKPGPLYGVSGDQWQALAVALTWMEKQLGPADGR